MEVVVLVLLEAKLNPFVQFHDSDDDDEPEEEIVEDDSEEEVIPAPKKRSRADVLKYVQTVNNAHS